MPKYLAVFYETQRYERIIEAADEETARLICRHSDDDEVTLDNEYYDWELSDVREIK